MSFLVANATGAPPVWVEGEYLFIVRKYTLMMITIRNTTH